MTELDFSKIGLKMKQLRVENGYTQEMVADALHCTVAFVSNLENNRAKLNLRVLLYYSELCHVTVDEILAAGSADRTPSACNKAVNAELLRIFQSYDPEDQKKILKTLKLWKKTDLKEKLTSKDD